MGVKAATPHGFLLEAVHELASVAVTPQVLSDPQAVDK